MFSSDCQLTEFCLLTRSWELCGLSESAALQPPREHDERGNSSALKAGGVLHKTATVCINSLFASSTQVPSPFGSGSVYDMMGKTKWEANV